MNIKTDTVTGRRGDAATDLDKIPASPRRLSFTVSDLLGKPFKYGGRGPLEYDCYGLCMEICKRRGIALPDFGSSPSATWIHRMISDKKELFVELKKPEPGALVTFWIRPGYTTHLGVILEDGTSFMHILQKEKVIIERIDSKLWAHRITGFYNYIPLPPRGEVR
jgi:cell wall-associated NlpC family hydrolase